MSDFWTRAKKINNIQTVNSDPLLSQFRHHFTIMKVHLPRKMNLQSFAEKAPNGFGLPSNSFSHSVYIAQFVNVYDQDLVDIAIAFRRDQIAIQIATGKLQFKHDNETCKVQLSNGFKIFMQELRSLNNQGKNRDEKESSVKAQNLNNEELKKKESQLRIEKKDSYAPSNKFNKQNKQRSRSRSRSQSQSGSRSREKKKQIFNRISSGSQVPHLQKSLSQRLQPQKWR